MRKHAAVIALVSALLVGSPAPVGQLAAGGAPPEPRPADLGADAPVSPSYLPYVGTRDYLTVPVDLVGQFGGGKQSCDAEQDPGAAHPLPAFLASVS